MIDTHCHLDVTAFADDVDAVVARATAAGVTGMLVPAIRPAMWPALAALVERHRGAGMRLAIGVHPQIVPELAPGEIGGVSRDAGFEHDAGIDGVAAWIAREALAYGAVAIGECGLDGATADMPRQEALFRAHIRAARITRVPLVIHVLRAHDLAPRVLREELSASRAMPSSIAPAPASMPPPIAGVLHSYSGGTDLVDVYRDLGLAFSFAGPVSYPNARKPVEAARAIPAHLLLAETDAPDQAPEGHRGGRSEPAFVAVVIAGLAAARGVTAEEIAALTTANAQRIFRTWRTNDAAAE
ncbi:MAG: TatD family hydrolase [Kofleriaceae bacterium]